MFTDRCLRTWLLAAPFLIRQGIGWREDAWTRVQEGPQVHADLSLLYFLREVVA